MKQKNLLIISHTFPNKDNTYIGDVFVKEQIDSLKKYFNNVFVIIPCPYGIEYYRKTKQINYQYDNVQVYFPKFFALPFWYFYLKNMWVKAELKSICKVINKEAIKVDLIHAHYTWPSGVVAKELKKYFKVPTIITEHTHTLYENIDKNKKYYLETWNQCDAIIRMNKKDISYFSDLGIPSNKIFYIPNGCNIDKFENIRNARNILNIPNNKYVIFNLGLLHEYKGQKYLIEALKEVIKVNQNVSCYIGGYGPLEKYLKRRITDLNLENHVKLIGPISRDKVPFWMSACDLFVLPSISESFGIVQLEAMACGKPVVATYNGASEDFINEKCGLLVAPKDSYQLAQNIISAIHREWDADEIKNIASGFSWKHNVAQIIDIYKNILKIKSTF